MSQGYLSGGQGILNDGIIGEDRVARGPTFLSDPRAVRTEYNSLRAREREILAGLPAMTTDVFNCHEVPIKGYLCK